MKKIWMLLLGLVLLASCSSGKALIKTDVCELTLKKSEQVTPTSYKATVEFLFLNGQRKDVESLKVDCQASKITIYERLSFDKDGKLALTHKFNVDNEFNVVPDTFGQVIFKHFCVPK